ncbi:DUF6884 domain-containing protein [Cupriavidus basilensis]|uniref:DUF6884 domain-containing protein n=1 Tax=Cupriavidus basilensis TaxID=68895 RepID=A0A643FSX5_9BURK|nr:DUF6884 domain-containing protein [Cupriavidus basilensis]QOT82229.1 hypothetical protein F7R26_039665 [Cupriavidus basilensis]
MHLNVTHTNETLGLLAMLGVPAAARQLTLFCDEAHEPIPGRSKLTRRATLDLFALTASASTKAIASLAAKVARFASGMSRARDFGAAGHAGHAGHAVGVDVGQLSRKAMGELAEMVATKRTPVFVDSGAYSMFRRQQADLAAGKKVVALDFGQILARYEQLAELIHEKNEAEEQLPAPLVSLPDVIGDQHGSLDLLKHHSAWIKATAQFNVLRLLVPIPRGDSYTLSHYYDAAVLAAGTDNFVVGIPTVANPWSPAEVTAFLLDRKPQAIHFLGSLHDSRLTKWLKAIVNAGMSDAIEVSADANPLRSMVLPRDGTKLAPGERCDRIIDGLSARARATELSNVFAQYGGRDQMREALGGADFERQQRLLGLISDLSGTPQEIVRRDFGLADGPIEGDRKVEHGTEYVLRNGRWRTNAEQSQSAPSSTKIVGSERLLLVACSAAKRQGRYPAAALYTGALYGVLNKWIPAGHARPDVHILSAKHGLVNGATELETYDQRMTPQRAKELAAQGLDLSQFNGKRYREVFIAGGADYREVARAYVQQLQDAGVIAADASLESTKGGIGEIRGQLGAYLRSCTFDSL